MEIMPPPPLKFLATPQPSLVADEENLVIGFGPPNFRNASAIAATCQIIFPRKILGSFSANYGPADVMTFFFSVFTCFWAEKWTSADMMTLKEPVLLLRNKNMATLYYKYDKNQSTRVHSTDL